MLRPLLQLALTRRPLILLFMLGFIGAGGFAFYKLNIEAYPNPAPVILEITAQQPGLAAEEMERLYTIPLEVGLANTPGVSKIRSTSFYGLSFVRVTFNYGVDYYFAYTQTALNLQQNVSLPNHVQPQIQASSLVGEIYRYQLRAPKHFGLTQLRTLQDWVLQRRLLTVPGVAQVVSWGGTTKEYEVEVDLSKLDAYGLSLPQVISAIGNANVDVGGRTVEIGQQSANIRGLGLIRNVDDLGAIVLRAANGTPLQVRDIAKVTVGAESRLGIAGRDYDGDVVTAIVVMNRTMHTQDVVQRVKAMVEQINHDGTLPPGVKIDPYYDRSQLVAVTTKTVLHSLLFGCTLVFLIQWIFLGDLRSAIIVSLNIPCALFFSIILLVLSGESANLLSLGAVDFGIIVDSSVILVENIFRNAQAPLAERQALLKNLPPHSDTMAERRRLIFASALQVDKSVLFSAAITISAFVPLFTMQGVEGQIFGPMARTYAYALGGALIATFTLTPTISSWLLPVHIEEKETYLVRQLRRCYSPLLHWALSHRNRALAIGMGCLALALLLLSRLGSEFLPTLEEGNLWIRASLPPTISLQAGTPMVERMRALLLKHPEVVTVVSQHGRPDDGSDASGFNNVELFVPLQPFEQWPAGMTKAKLVAQLQREFANEFVGVSFNFSQYIQDNVEEGLSGVKGANAVKIVGPDLGKLERLAQLIKDQLAQVRGVADLGIFHVLGQPNLDIRIDRAKAARYGLNTGDINTVVQAALGGATPTTVQEGSDGRQFNLEVRIQPQQRHNLDEIRALKIDYATPNGQIASVPLSAVADISLDTGASFIYHESNERFIPVKFSIRGRDLGGTITEARQRIAAHVALPRGYRLIWAGEFQELKQAEARLLIAIPISLLLILGLLYGLFNSLRDSLLALAGIPFAMAGGILALAVSGLNFSVSAAIGFISLFGVSVMDGILMITYYNELTSQGRAHVQAIYLAAEHRMRPMLMTALSACIGLLPAALSHGIGSQVQRPLATVVVGGMLLGPFMLLVIVPALRLMIIERQEHN